MKKAVIDTATGAVIKWGFTDFLNDYNASTQSIVDLNEGAVPPEGTPDYYCKIVSGEFVEMTAGEKTAVDNAGLSPFVTSSELTDFVDANARVTDAATGIQGPFELMQVMVNRRELFNDTDSPLYIPEKVPILGASGMLQDHANRVANLEDIHAKNAWHRQDIVKATYSRPLDLLIYYGWPSTFNALGSNEAIAKEMARYGVIVLGAGLQDPSHGDYANTQVIINRIKVLNPYALIFGYVATTEVIATFQTKTGQWNTLGIHGIFMDMAGYDYGINRADFNTRVDYVHGRTSSNLCFVNAWNIDHILGTANDVSYPNTTWNPTLVASNLTYNDWYLLESFPINTTAYSGNAGYEAKADWAARGVKATSLRATYGINLAAVGIIDNTSANGQALFNFLFISSLQFSFEASGSSDVSYASGTSTVYWWYRLSVIELGVEWSLNPSVQVDTSDADVYWRYVERGRLMLDHSTGAQLAKIIYENGLGIGAEYIRKEGTTNYEAWYTSPITGTALTTGALTANRLYAIPFVVSKRTVLDRIAINVTTAGTGNARLGIYEDLGTYPSKLLLDAGAISIATTGVKSVTISHVLTNGLKWLVIVSNGTPTIRSFAVASLSPVLGYGNTLGTAPNLGLYTAFTYAALPASFPASPTMITAVPIPAVFVRLNGVL